MFLEVPLSYCLGTFYNSLCQRTGWTSPPTHPTRLVPVSLTVQSVQLVRGGGPAIKPWTDLIQRRKGTDTGTLETMAACRSYSERLPPPLPFPPSKPRLSHLSRLVSVLWRRKCFVSALGHQSRWWTKSGSDSLLARSSVLFGFFFNCWVGCIQMYPDVHTPLGLLLITVLL